MVWQNVSDESLDSFLSDAPSEVTKRSKAFEKFASSYLPDFRKKKANFRAPSKLPLTEREAKELLDALRDDGLSQHGVAIVTPLFPELVKYE